MKYNLLVLSVFYRKTFGSNLDIDIATIYTVLDMLRTGKKYKAIMLLCKATHKTMTTRMHQMINRMEAFPV